MNSIDARLARLQERVNRQKPADKLPADLGRVDGENDPDPDLIIAVANAARKAALARCATIAESFFKEAAGVDGEYIARRIADIIRGHF